MRFIEEDDLQKMSKIPQYDRFGVQEFSCEPSVESSLAALGAWWG
jgi:hypothetical protein